MNFIHPDDTPEMAITKLSGGDKLAERTLTLITSTAEMVEPGRESRSIPEPLIMLDALEIVGEEIVALHKACGSSPFHTVAVLRAYELGLIGSSEMKDVAYAIPGEDGKVPTLDVDGLTAKVREFLPKFGLSEAMSMNAPSAPGNSLADTHEVQNQAQDQRSTNLLTAEDTPSTAMAKLGLGDERAERTLAMIAGMAEIVDRNAITGSMAPLMTLDSLGITGEKVIAFHEACGSPFATVAVLRARQLGFVSDEQLQKVASAKPGVNVGGADVGDLDVKDLIVQVTEALPKFRLPNALQGSSHSDTASVAPGAGRNPVPSVPKNLLRLQQQRPKQGKDGIGGQ